MAPAARHEEALICHGRLYNPGAWRGAGWVPSMGFLVAGPRVRPRLPPRAPAAHDCSAVRRQVFVLVGLSVFIASAKMAIDQDSASVAIDHAQMNDLKNIIKKQVKHSMAPAIKMQKRAVKARKTDTGEVQNLEHQV